MQTISSLPRVALEKAVRPDSLCGAPAVPAFRSLLCARRPEPASTQTPTAGPGTVPATKAVLRHEPPAAPPFAVPHGFAVSDVSKAAESPVPAAAAAVEVVAVERALDAAGRFGPVQCIRLEIGGGTVTVRPAAGGTGVAVEITTDPRMCHETRRAIVDAVRRRAPGAAVSERRRGAR